MLRDKLAFRILAVAVTIAFALMLLGGLFSLIYEHLTVKAPHVITAPAMGRPSLSARGGHFSVLAKLPADSEVKSLSLSPVLLRNDQSRLIQVVNRVKLKNGLTRLTARAPFIVPPGLYDLTLQFTNGAVSAVDSRPCSVKITEGGEPVSFAVMGGPGDPGPGGFTGEKLKKLKSMLREINLMDPDFLVILGGAGSEPWSGRNLAVFSDLLRRELLAPAFIVPSAGDLRKNVIASLTIANGAAEWRKNFPISRHYFDGGSARFIFVPARPCASGKTACLRKDDAVWLAAAAEDAVTRGKYPVVFMPDIPLPAESAEFTGVVQGRLDTASSAAALRALRENGATVFTAGMDRDAVLGRESGVTIVNTGRADGVSRYRLATAGPDGLKGMFHAAPPHAVPFGKVRLAALKPNDGSAGDNRMVVSNDLGRDLNDLSAVAVMKPPKTGGYKVDGAEVVSRLNGPRKVFLFLSFDARKNKRTTITITGDPAAK